jgi:hypothetical protein
MNPQKNKMHKIFLNLEFLQAQREFFNVTKTYSEHFLRIVFIVLCTRMFCKYVYGASQEGHCAIDSLISSLLEVKQMMQKYMQKMKTKIMFSEDEGETQQKMESLISLDSFNKR